MAAAQSTRTLVDIAAGPTDDVVVADRPASGTFEQMRWSSAGSLLSSHQDPSGTFTGPLFTSGLFIDPGNDAFYGMLQTGPQGTNTQVKLVWTRLGATGNTVFAQSSAAALATTAGAPTVTFLQVGGDATGNLHGAFLMGSPQYLTNGVYCYWSDGSNLGAAAQNVASTLTPKDYLWPSLDNDLVLFKSYTASTNLGCGALTVPAAGGFALAKFTGGGVCVWNKLLALPTAAVKASNFRLGADGSMEAAVVFSGSIDFGGGALVSTGTTSLALARFDSAGGLLWTKLFGGTGSSFKLGSVGANANGNVFLTSGYAGSVNLGGGNLPTTADTFLAVFDSGGHLKWSKTVTVGSQGGLVAAAGKCRFDIATDSPSVNLGNGPIAVTPSGASTIGVAALGM